MPHNHRAHTFCPGLPEPPRSSHQMLSLSATAMQGVKGWNFTTEGTPGFLLRKIWSSSREIPEGTGGSQGSAPGSSPGTDEAQPPAPSPQQQPPPPPGGSLILVTAENKQSKPNQVQRNTCSCCPLPFFFQKKIKQNILYST